MNKEEIKHFKAMLRQGSLRHMNILLDDKFQKELLNIIKDYEKLQNNWNELKKFVEETIKENDTTIKKCDQVIFKMGNEHKKDTHQHKLIDVCSRENLVFNRIVNKMQELENRKV